MDKYTHTQESIYELNDVDALQYEYQTITEIGAVGKTLLAGNAGGGYLIYRYFTSINRYKRKIKETEDKIKKADSPSKKEKLNDKLNTYKLRLEKSQIRGRLEQKKTIKKYDKIKDQIKKLKSTKSLSSEQKESLNKLIAKEKKLSALMSKIGHI